MGKGQDREGDSDSDARRWVVGEKKTKRNEQRRMA
jgi:hypothetical protein